jgi:hypothetical protein
VEFVSQHSSWVGAFLTALVIPLALGGATLWVFCIDAREKLEKRQIPKA